MSALDNQEIANLFVSNFASVYSSGLIANMIATPISIIITSYCLRAKFRNLYLNWAQEQRVVWMRSHFCLLRTVLFNLRNPWPFYSTDLFRQESSPILDRWKNWKVALITPIHKSGGKNRISKTSIQCPSYVNVLKNLYTIRSVTIQVHSSLTFSLVLWAAFHKV